jgi:ubiquinone/menaquinone biosynthesis C-methylase UbiE
MPPPGQPFTPPPGFPFAPSGDAPRPPDYANPEYWDQRYGAKPEPFEWYQTWPEIYAVVKDYISGAESALNVGCGNSPMSVEMRSVFRRVVNIDISSVIIEEMSQRFAQFTDVEWHVMDCTQMTFGDGTFDAIFDKGTLDALLCDETSIPVLIKVLREVYRVLKPSGYFFEITYGTPQLRNSIFAQLGLDWRMLEPVTIENPRRHAWHWIYTFQKPPFVEAVPAPAVPFPEPDYASVEYWDYRYSLKPAPFEWYQTWPEVYDAIRPLCRGGKRALNIGCGNSPMSVEMGKVFQTVVNIDVSSVVIKQMSEQFRVKTKITWQTMDWVSLEFKDNSFDIVFDKGTQDAILCAKDAVDRVTKSMKEAHRVLKRAGYFFEITYAAPQQRMDMFRGLGLEWRILNPITIENPRRKAWHWIYCFQKL